MKSTYLIILSSLFLLSCTNFLDEESTGTMSIDSNLSSVESCTALANSTYVNTNVFDANEGTWGGNTIWLLEFMTGKVNSEASQTEFLDFRNLTLNSRSRYIEKWWADCYAGIAKANLAIKKIPEFSGVDKNIRSRLLGEAYFMRALYYFYLVRIFGDLPKIKEVQSELVELYIPRSPIKEIYDEIIIPDLLNAEQSSLPIKDETGRVSMGAVKSLLADVYLTYAGFPVQGGKKYYAESAKKSLEVISSGVYSLYPEYSDLRQPSNNNKKEFIFQVQFSMDKSHNDMIPKVLPPKSDISAYSSEYGSLVPTKEFYESFRENDKRAQEREFFFSSYPGNPKKLPADSPNLEKVDFGGFYIYKFFDENAIVNTAKSDLNWTLYRYADVLLMYAEAQVEADGHANSTALEALNLVRRRAKLPDFMNSNKEVFKEAVWDERYFELCFEGKIWFDMVRTRKIRNDFNGKYENFTEYTTVYGKRYTNQFLLFPLPQREMNANTALVQNEGY